MGWVLKELLVHLNYELSRPLEKLEKLEQLEKPAEKLPKIPASMNPIIINNKYYLCAIRECLKTA